MFPKQLIQTGRAFKKAREDGPRDLDHVQNSLRSHMEHSMNEFHRNLDDIECEIVRRWTFKLREERALTSSLGSCQGDPVTRFGKGACQSGASSRVGGAEAVGGKSRQPAYTSDASCPRRPQPGKGRLEAATCTCGSATAACQDSDGTIPRYGGHRHSVAWPAVA